VLFLAREIVAGRIPPNDALPPELELVRKFGISKVVIRECIQELAGYGMIRVQHGKRTVVLDQSEWNVLAPLVQEAYRLAGGAEDMTDQAYDVRLVLEMNAVGLAAERRSASHLDELDALVEAMRSIAMDTREVTEFLVKDRAFHDVVGRATGNMVLRAMMRDLHNLLVANWTGSRTTPAQLKLLAKQHAAIAEAIRSRNPATARRAMEAHLRWAKGVETQRASGENGPDRNPVRVFGGET